jgi:hypothetical protein
VYARGVDNLHVAVLVLPVQFFRTGVDTGLVVTQLQETLDTTRRVLGALTVVAVGQVHDETGALEPLAFSGSDELVNDTLSVVAVDQCCSWMPIICVTNRIVATQPILSWQ